MKTRKVFKVSSAGNEAGLALEARIIEAGRELFFSRGFVRVTADEISARLGISKATLYKAFPSKEAILRAVVSDFLRATLARVEGLLSDARLGFAEKLVGLFAYVGARISEIGPLLVRDIQKSAPGVWREIDDFRRDRIFENFKGILESGRREGLFREDVDLDLLVEMFADLVGRFINPEAVLRSGRSPAQAFESVIKVFFQGILTEAGRRNFTAPTPALFEPRKEGTS